MKTRILFIVLAMLLLIIPANATLVEDWPMGKTNVIPNDTIGIMYDFEEGSNCEVPFKNQYPEVAKFLTVPSTQLGMGDNLPSYVTVGGSMCGTTRCYMNIYPSSGGIDWIYIVNNRSAFAPVQFSDGTYGGLFPGEGWPGQKASIEFKENINYISFLASTGNDLRVRLFNAQGNSYNLIHSDTIHVNYYRTNGEPSNFTQFSINTGNVDIDRMELYGPFNAWHIDDLIVGTSFVEQTPNPTQKPTPNPTPKPTPPPTPAPTPAPTPESEPYTDYTYVAENAIKLIGEEYQEHMLGYDYTSMEYMKVEIFGYLMDFWNPVTKSFEYGSGISDEGLIIWSYNQPYFNDDGNKDLIKWCTSEGMKKHDFTIEVDTLDIRPSDVFFIDSNNDDRADTIGMVIKSDVGGTNIIISEEGYGVHTKYSHIIESTPGFMGYFRLPEKINGGHNPIPKSNK